MDDPRIIIRVDLEDPFQKSMWDMYRSMRRGRRQSWAWALFLQGSQANGTSSAPAALIPAAPAAAVPAPATQLEVKATSSRPTKAASSGGIKGFFGESHTS